MKKLFLVLTAFMLSLSTYSFAEEDMKSEMMEDENMCPKGEFWNEEKGVCVPRPVTDDGQFAPAESIDSAAPVDTELDIDVDESETDQ